MQSLDLEIDVSDQAGLAGATIALTVTLPDPCLLPARPVVCFAKPGAGYSAGYFTHPLPGPGTGAQASWHAARGWIFVAADLLGSGRSSQHHGRDACDYTALSAAGHAAEAEVLRRLAASTLSPGFPRVAEPVILGLGQSMGGCITLVQQARYRTYHGIAVLGYSAVHTIRPAQPGTPPFVRPWVPRDVVPATASFRRLAADPRIPNGGAVTEAEETGANARAVAAMRWYFHYDDVGSSVDDISDFPRRNGNLPPWASAAVPSPTAAWCVTPGAVAPEAAAITVPVLVGLGERDVSADPRGEARAYLSCPSLDLFICPRMGHMHNFAGTRELLWRRVDTWGGWVSAQFARPAGDGPAAGPEEHS
jgi:alpha-beta hydrolase superfamily lysophospholipase